MSSSAKDAARPNRGRAAGPANRAALLAAAREVFGEQGLSAPLSAVARRAGVGQGSLYRHFPSRTALAAAVFDENLNEVEQFVAASGTGLTALFDVVCAQAVVSTAMIDLVEADRHDPDVERLGARFAAIVGRLVRTERETGALASHVDVDDVLLAVGMIATVLARSDEDERAALATRGRAIFARAFRPAASSDAR